MRTQEPTLAAVALAALTAAGCPSSTTDPNAPGAAGGEPSPDGSGADEVCSQGVPVAPSTDQVDVLFVIDNSNSMLEEQVTLARELPRMVQILASGDRTPETDLDNEDPGVRFQPVKSLHLGVVSTNMGANGNAVPGCMGQGDDAVLLAGGAAGDPACTAAYPQYLEFAAVDDEARNLANAAALGADFACVSQLGTFGCGLEQQLEAALKAVAYEGQRIDIYDPVGEPELLTFSGNTPGHGGGANDGFVRDDSVLAVVVVTDEDDCSIPDSSRDLFSLETSSAFADEPLNLRCGMHSDPSDPTLHPIERYAEGLKGLRPGKPEQVIFAAIAGVPPDLGQQLAEGTLSIRELLEQPLMQFRPADEVVVADTLPVASCNTASGVAFPPRRLVAVADEFNVPGGVQNGVVRSICEDDYGPALEAVIERIADRLDGSCFSPRLPRLDNGFVACDIIEVPSAADPTPCAAPGRTMVGSGTLPGEEGRPLCLVEQLPVERDESTGMLAAESDKDGWYYDDFSESTLRTCGQRLRFTEGAEPPRGATVRIECDPSACAL